MAWLTDLRARLFIFPLITHLTHKLCMWKAYAKPGSALQNICFLFMWAPIMFQKGIWSSLLVVIRVMMINDYNNKIGIIGSNCAFWNGLRGGQVVGRETAASAWGSRKDALNWLKAALLIALSRAREKALVWLYMNGVPLEALWFWGSSVLQNASRKENRCSATW